VPEQGRATATPPRWCKECVALVRDKIGPVAAFKHAVVVDRLPKTRSGKILRATMAQIADGQELKVPATIDDPAILDEIAAALIGAHRLAHLAKRSTRSRTAPCRATWASFAPRWKARSGRSGQPGPASPQVRS
jgi:hypothetical protein